MKAESLQEVYSAFGEKISKVYVVPLIRFNHPETDYLYLLYEKMLSENTYSILSLSVFGHFKPILSRLRNQETILHYHWLHFQDLKALTGMPWKLFCIWLYKLLGGNLVWTVHNLTPHDQKWLSLHNAIYKWMAKKADKIHIHCNIVKEEVAQAYNAEPEKIFTLPHPEYNLQRKSKDESITFLNTTFDIEINYSKSVFLMFGNISEYKGIPEVIELFKSEFKDAQLIIAGPIKKGNDELAAEIRGLMSDSSNIILVPDFIQDEQIPFFFGASDAAVFNFRTILTSGTVKMAESFDKAIIAPNKGCLSEYSSNTKFHLFNNKQELTQSIKKVIATLPYEEN